MTKGAFDEQSNPGSEESIEQGCLCPILDNGRGRGRGYMGKKNVFIYSYECPLHCHVEKEENRQK